MTSARAGDGGALARNATWLAVGRVGSHLFAVVLTVVLARGMGTAGFGQYAFLSAVVVIGNVITTFGTESLLVREIAARRGDPARLLTAALVLQLTLSAAVVAFVAAGAGWLPGRTGPVVTALRIYVLSLFPLAFNSVFSAALRGWERMDLYASFNVVTSALQAAAALAAVRARAGVPALVLWLLLAQIAAAVLGRLLCGVARPGFAFAGGAAPAAITNLFQRAWPFALLAGLAIVGQRIGVLLLGLLAGDAPAGWFAAAARVVEGLKLVHYAFLGALLPLASRVVAQGASGGDAGVQAAHQRLAGLVRRSRLVLLALGVGAAVAASALATPIVTLLYGSAYHPAIEALRILAWGLLPLAATAPTSLALVTTGHERVVLRAAGAAVLVTTGLGLWLIPRLGVNGACAAVLAGEALLSALLLFETSRIAASRRRE